jgi:phage gp36-like protein
MQYATLADMITRFREEELVQLTDLDNSGDIVVPKVQAALDDAAAVMDTYLQQRYTLPLASVPRVLLNICCDLARAALYEDGVTDVVQKRADAAMQMLRDLATGKIGLGLDPAAQTTAPEGGPQVTEGGGGRVFSGDLLADYTRGHG